MQMLPVDIQLSVEHKFSRANIDKYILRDIRSSDELNTKIENSVLLIREWISKEHYFSKRERLKQLESLDLKDLVEELMVHILPIRLPETLTSVVGRVSSLLGYSSKIEGIKTLSEILAIICETDLFDISKSGRFGILYIKSNYGMSEELTNFINQTKYLPPMVCEPKILKDNSDSGYLTKRDSLILGSGNFHHGNICLDSLNKFNQIPLSLDVQLLKKYREMSKKELNTKEKEEAYNKMVTDSYRVYVDLINQGNKFYLTHKVDKRGRTYAQGYHVNTQGSDYKKAIINLHKKELIEGVF